MQAIIKSFSATFRHVLYGFALVSALSGPLLLSGCGTGEEAADLDTSEEAELESTDAALRNKESDDGVPCKEVLRDLVQQARADGLQGCELLQAVKQGLFEEGCIEREPRQLPCGGQRPQLPRRPGR